MVRDIRKIKGESIKETDVLEDAKSKAKYVIPLPPVTDNYRKKQILIYEGTWKWAYRKLNWVGRCMSRYFLSL